MDTITLKKQWRALPRELAHIIAEFSGAFKTRNGVLVSQIAKYDPRRDMLLTIPKIVSYIEENSDGEDKEIQVVESTRQIDGDTVVIFRIMSEIVCLTDNHMILFSSSEKEYNLCYTRDVYRHVEFYFHRTTVRVGRIARHPPRAIIKSDGSAKHILEFYN